VHGARVTPNLFQLLETHAEIGRVLGPVDGESTSTRVAVLGHGCWRERFNADPAMVSRTVRMDGEVYMVVGSSYAGRCGKEATDAPRRSWATAAGLPLVGASHNRLWSRLEGLCRRIAVTWKDKLEIGLKEDAPYRKDNLPASEIRGPEKPAGPGRSPEIPMARAHKTPPSTQARTRTTARKPGPTSPEPSARARRKPRTA
jgi:hypothetical protein